MKETFFIDVHTHRNIIEHNVLRITNIFPNQDTPNSGFSIGIHPWFISEDWRLQLEEVVEKASSVNCLAIGECGFDKTVDCPMSEQVAIFKAHVELAEKLQKPLVIHCVKAFDELLKHCPFISVPIILHDFGKNAILGKQLQSKGIYLSVGRALFRESFAQEFFLLDSEKLFLETDDMDCSIEKVYQKAVELLGCEFVSLQRQIQHNFNKVFK